MSRSSLPVHVTSEQELAWSPHAPELTFRVAQGGWGMGENFRLQYLRLKLSEGDKSRQTIVNRNKEGQAYYLPHWPLFTALIDAQSESEISAAAREMAQLDPGQTAPELGFRAPVAIQLLMRKSPSAKDIREQRTWEQESTFLSYWSKLGKEQQERARTLRWEGWGLLDLAVRERQFLVAERLWAAGLRFAPNLAQEGIPAWALTEGLHGDIPGAQDTLNAWGGKRTLDFLRRISEEEQAPGLVQALGDWDETRTKANAFVALTQRWLRRMTEDGTNFNAPVTVHSSSPGQEEKTGQRTAFMQAMHRPPRELGEDTRQAWARVWAKAMLDGGYDFKKEVLEPFILKTQAPASIAAYVEEVCEDEEIKSWVLAAFLETDLNAIASREPRSRL